MFEDRSLRIVASSILWSVGLIFASVATHGTLYGVDFASENVGYVQSLVRSMVIGSFVGVPFGIILNAGVHPFKRNLFAAIGCILAVGLVPKFADLSANLPGEAWQRCLPFLYLFALIAGLIPYFLKPAKKLASEEAKDMD